MILIIHLRILSSNNQVTLHQQSFTETKDVFPTLDSPGYGCPRSGTGSKGLRAGLDQAQQVLLPAPRTGRIGGLIGLITNL